LSSQQVNIVIYTAFSSYFDFILKKEMGEDRTAAAVSSVAIVEVVVVIIYLPSQHRKYNITCIFSL
jgi:hypothetical protein